MIVPHESWPAVLGARLRDMRVARGVSQQVLEERTGMYRSNISRLETGRHGISIESLMRYCAGLGVAPSLAVMAIDGLEDGDAVEREAAE